ncbi:sensor histidine kinase [Patulibacter sp.]|uniref:sensor histidine kinase n=1 Tax=Patulibacter sp. TaxID=1912859 RepID=UPI00271B343C|nr:histidine kinase [Patulibacter sp.]MDO9407017.1 histidine kinase [Patulibacter sp.]
MTVDADTPERPPRWQSRLWAWGPVAVVVVAFGGTLALGAQGPWWIAAAVLTAGSYAIRGRRPLVAVLLVCGVVGSARLPGASVVGSTFDAPYLLLLALLVLPLAELASRARPRTSVVGLVVVLAVSVAIAPEPVWSGDAQTSSAAIVTAVLGLGVPAMVACGAWLAGYALRARQRTVDVLLAEAELRERARAADAERAVLAERARIGRDVHDLVTHTVAVMVVQAAAADAVWDTSPAQARAAVRAVETSGRAAMADLRTLLREVQEDDGPGPPLGALAGLEHLEGLADSIRAAGLDARLSVRGPRADVPSATGVSLLRIAQESVTNALRHAAARSVAIALVVDHDTVDLSIADDGVGPDGAPTGGALDRSGAGGRGVPGMRERARSIGGTLTIAAAPAGGTVVTVRAPMAGSPAP